MPNSSLLSPRSQIKELVINLAHGHLVGSISHKDLVDRLELPSITIDKPFDYFSFSARNSQEIEIFAARATEQLLKFHNDSDPASNAIAEHLIKELNDLLPAPEVGSAIVYRKLSAVSRNLEEAVCALTSRRICTDGNVVIVPVAKGDFASACIGLVEAIKDDAKFSLATLNSIVSFAGNARIGLNEQERAIDSWLENRAPWKIRIVEEGSSRKFEIGLQELHHSSALHMLDVLKWNYLARELEIVHLFHNPKVEETFSSKVGNLLLRVHVWPQLHKEARRTLIEWHRTDQLINDDPLSSASCLDSRKFNSDSILSKSIKQLDLIVAEKQEFHFRCKNREISELPLFDFPLKNIPAQLGVLRILNKVSATLPSSIIQESKLHVLETIEDHLFESFEEDRRQFSILMKPKVFSFCCECKNAEEQAIFIITSPRSSDIVLPNESFNSSTFENNSEAKIDCEVYIFKAGDPDRCLSLSSDLHKLVSNLMEQIWLRDGNEDETNVWVDPHSLSVESLLHQDPLVTSILDSFSRELLHITCRRHPYVEEVLESIGAARLAPTFGALGDFSASELIITIAMNTEDHAATLSPHGELGVERISDWLASFALFEGELSIGSFLESITLWGHAASIKPAEPSLLQFNGNEEFKELLEQPERCSITESLGLNLLCYSLTPEGAANLESLLLQDLVKVDAINPDAIYVLNSFSESEIYDWIVSSVALLYRVKALPVDWIDVSWDMEQGVSIERLKLSAGCWSNLSR